jgi:hypothetical protein
MRFSGSGTACYRATMRKLMLLLAFSAYLGASLAQPIATPAVNRQLPVNAQRAETGDNQPLPVVVLNNEAYRLAPGGIIIDANNRTITHNRLPQGADVLYTQNAAGEITRIVILRPEEQARLDSIR